MRRQRGHRRRDRGTGVGVPRCGAEGCGTDEGGGRGHNGLLNPRRGNKPLNKPLTWAREGWLWRHEKKTEPLPIRKGGGRARETSASRLHRGEAATGVAAQPEFKLQASSFKLKLQLAAADQQLLMGTTGCIADDCILKNPKAQLLNASGGAPVDY